MAEKFEVDQIVSILKNDSDLNAEFKDLGFTLIPQYTSGDTAPKFTGDTYIGSHYLTITGYSALAEYYLANVDAFTANTAIYLSGNATICSALWANIIDPASTPYGYFTPVGGFTDSALAHWLVYSFKYSAVKTFFRQKYKYFLPEFDYDMINSEEKTKMYQEAFMREFDRFTMIIDNLYNIVDIDKIPTEYLNYLAQIIGYEREDYQLLTNSSFRELLKNIIEIYRIKGTNYSFELFFNLLGFEIIPQEFWFDRRFGDTSISANAYTASTDKDSYLFYLTPNKPTDAIPTGMSRSYPVSKDLITEPMDLNAFDRLASAYTNGDSSGYSSYHLTGNTSINPFYGLQGHWSFNEGTGDTVLDLSPNRYKMTLYNTEWTRSGYSSTPQIYFADQQAIRYAKTSKVLDYATGKPRIKEFSTTFWASKLKFGDSCIAISLGATNVDGFYISADSDGAGLIRFNDISGVHEDLDIPAGTFDTELRFYALTFNGTTKKATFYKNSVTILNEVLTIDVSMPSCAFYVGNYSVPKAVTGWTGTIEDVRFYTRELSSYEVKHLFAPLGDTYTYFKTNVIQYHITSLGTGQEADLSAADLESIEFYAEFLSPIFVERNILFSARPSIESAVSAWTLLDETRSDPIYMNRTGALQSFYNRSYAIQSIDARAGDTFYPRGKIVVNNISSGAAKTTLMELLNPTGDSLVGKYVIDNITIAGTGAVANDGVYYLSADTLAPSYNSSTKQVTIYLKGDTDVGMHGSSKATPSGTLYIGGPDRMMHLYSGYYPDKRYWDGNLFEASRTIPGGSELIRLDDTKNRTSDDKIATKNSDLIFEWPTYGTAVTSNRVRWAGKGVTGFWGPIVNKIATENLADTSKWNVWPVWNTNYKKIYDTTIGDYVFSWSTGTDIYRTIIGDTNQSPGDTGHYYTSMWIKSTRDIKITPFFSRAGDTLFGDTNVVLANTWTFIEPTISSLATYNGFGWWIKGNSSNLTSGDTFKVYNVQVEKSDFFTRPFAKPSLRGGDSLAYPLTIGDSGTFECWVRPHFNYNTTVNKFVMSDYTGDSVHIALKYNQATDKWTFSIMKDVSNYRHVSSTTAYISDASIRQWIHLKATWKVLSNFAELYVNGTAQHGDSTYAGTANTWAKNSYLSIGSTPYIAANYVFEGLITDALLRNYSNTNNFHWGDSSYWTQTTRLGKTGHWISGDHVDTRASYTAPEVSTSVYSKVAAANPTWNEEQIYENMRVLIKASGDSGLSAQNWNLRRRDAFLLVDAVRYLTPGHYSLKTNTSDTHPTGDSWVIYLRKSAVNSGIAVVGDSKIADSKVYWRHGGWIVPVYNPVEEVIGNFITLGANHPLRSWDIRPHEKYYVDYNITANADTTWGYNTGQVFYIDANNGSGQGVIRVLDHRRFVNNGDTLAVGDSIGKFRRLVKDDYVTLFDTKHEVNNVTRQVDAITWYGDTTEIIVKPPISAIDQINLFKGYLDFEQVRRIKNFSSDGGAPTTSRVVIYDGSQNFRNLKAGDTLQIIDSGDSNEGIYYADSVGHARIVGDSGLTTIMLHPVLPGGYGDSDRGMIRLYGGFWTLNNPKYTFMHDKFQMTELRKG